MFYDNNSFWEDSPKHYFDRDMIGEHFATIDKNKQNKTIVWSGNKGNLFDEFELYTKSPIKFTDVDWSSPVKETKIEDVRQFNKIPNSHSETQIEYTEGNVMASSQILQSHQDKIAPFEGSFKYNEARDLLDLTSFKNSSDRKRSVKSYTRSDNQSVAQDYVAHSKNSYKAEQIVFSKRESLSNTSSLSKINPCRHIFI